MSVTIKLLAEVANSERTFPPALDRSDGYDVTDDFIRYARPLMGGEMVRLPMWTAGNGSPALCRSMPSRNFPSTSRKPKEELRFND